MTTLDYALQDWSDRLFVCNSLKYENT
jgi:hypothetical protein